MAKSRDTIRPIWPKDLSSIVREGLADHAPLSDDAFAPGTVCVRDSNNELVECDDTLVWEPVELIWTDGATRFDTEETTLAGGTKTRYTTLVGPFIALIASNNFKDNSAGGPAVGMMVTKANNANIGFLSAKNSADLLTKAGGAGNEHLVPGLIIGQILSIEGNFVKCRIM